MARFLNTDSILTEFQKLVNTAKRELILITPYIDIKNQILNTISTLEKRGVEVLLVCREGVVSDEARKKLSVFTNLTVMHHSTVHAKCYFTETRMIISSLNMLEVSYKNNREMGVLIIAEESDSEDEIDFEFADEEAFEDAVKEVKMIVKASDFILKSKKIAENGFHYLFLQGKTDKLADVVKRINKVYDNKLFEVSKDRYNNEIICCHNYLEKVDVFFDVIVEPGNHEDVIWEINRAEIQLKHPEGQLESLNRKFKQDLGMLKNGRAFKYYWNHTKTNLTIYPKYREDFEKQPESFIVEKYRGEIEYVISYFKKFSEFKKVY